MSNLKAPALRKYIDADKLPRHGSCCKPLPGR